MESIFDEIDYICRLKFTIMKIKYSIIFLGIILVSLFSCSDSKLGQETDLEKENLKGDVVLVFTKNDGFVSLNLFNDRGMLTKKFSGSTGKYFTLDESIYDNERKILVKISSNFGDGLSNNENKYSYDTNGKLESINSQKSNNNSKDFNQNFKYNKDGELIKEDSKYDDMTISKEYFYSENKLDSIIYTNKIGDIVVNNTTEIYEKDKQINKHYDIESNENKVLTDITFYKKNNRGDCIEEVLDEFNSNGNKIKSTTKKYEYNYDEKGNWLQKREIEDGILKKTDNRTIIYKGGETSIYIDEMEKFMISLNGGRNNSNNSKESIESREPNGQNLQSNDNSSSNTYQEPERQQQPEKIKCNSCNGSGKCPTCSKSQQDGYYNGSGSYIKINEIRTGMVICTYCHGRGTFMKENDNPCSWCKGQGWVFCRVCNYNGRGNNTGQCQSCKGSGFRN